MDKRSGSYRLDVVPLIAMDDVVTIGSIAVGPFVTLAPTMYPRRSARLAAASMVRYHRMADGGSIPRPSVVAAGDLGALPVDPSPALDERIRRSIEGFRYAALLTNRLGYGPNSTHLHVEGYSFREGRGRYLTIRSRFTNVLGVRNHQQRAWPHVGPVVLNVHSLDPELLNQLASVVDKRSKLARRLWRSLWWFNQAHHDDPYQPSEFSILCLATAFEALIRPTDKTGGLQRALTRALGINALDDWVREFYGARSAISHGDEAWQPLFGAQAHIDHYRVARQVFPLLIEDRLVELMVRSKPHPLMQAFARGSIERLLASDEELIQELLPHSFHTLRLRRNWKARMDLRFLPVRMNGDDLSTTPQRYEALLRWIRAVAISACRSGAARYPADGAEYRTFARELAQGIPAWSSVHLIPPGVDASKYLEAQSQTPKERGLLEDISLVDLAEAMAAVENQRQAAEFRRS